MTTSTAHLIELPTSTHYENDFIHFPYYYYRLLIHYQPGETVVIHNNSFFARYVRSENRAIHVLETALQGECEAALATFDRVRMLRVPGFQATVQLPEAETYF